MSGYEPPARKRLREARKQATAEREAVERAAATNDNELHISAARVDLWLRYNGCPPWPGEDQAVVDETYPEAPLLRRDIVWLDSAYHRLRHQNYRLKQERDELTRRLEGGNQR